MSAKISLRMLQPGDTPSQRKVHHFRRYIARSIVAGNPEHAAVPGVAVDERKIALLVDNGHLVKSASYMTRATEASLAFGMALEKALKPSVAKGANVQS